MNLYRIKELLELISKENIEVLSTQEIISLGSILEKYLNQIILNKAKLKISDLKSNIPSDLLGLFLIESKGITKVSKKTTILELKQILEQLQEAEKRFKEKAMKYAKVLSKIKTSSLQESLNIINGLSSLEKKEMSLFANLTKGIKGSKDNIFMLSQAKKNNTEWVTIYQDSKKIISIFDVKVK